MKLVSIHKHTFILLLFLFGFAIVQGQTWTMQQCIDTAQVYNKNLQMSRNYMAIGEQKMKEAKANLLPKVTANVDYKYFTNLPYQLLPLSTFNPTAPVGQFKEAQFGVPHNINANLQLAMPLYNPQVYGAIQATKIASELTELQYQKTEEQIYFDISNLYYNAQILQYQLAFIDSNLINAERLLKNIQLLNAQLLAKGTDVSKIKLQVTQLASQKENMKSKYDQILNALKFAIGLPLDKILEVDSEVSMENTSEYLSYSTLDFKIAKTQNLLLQSELTTLDKSKFLPSVYLTATYGTSGFGYRDESNSFLNFFPIGFAGIQLSYPIFSGTVTKRKINQKKIELQNNGLLLGLINDQNHLQVENAKLQRTIAKRLLETTNEQIALAKIIYDQTIFQQKQGTAHLADVLLADNALREAQQTYISVMIDYLKADLELKKLTVNISTTKYN